MKSYNQKMLIILGLPLIAIILNLYVVESLLAWHDQKFYPSSLVLGGVPLAGMTREEAERIWPDKVKKAWGDSLTLQGPEKNFTIPLEEWNIAYDTQASLQKAVEVMQEEREKSLLPHITIRGEKRELFPVFTWQEKDLQLKVMALALKEIKAKDPENARLYWDDKQGLRFMEERYGYEVDPVATYKNLTANLEKGIIKDIDIKTVPLTPEITREKIKEIKALLNIEAFKAEASYPSWQEMLDRLNGRVILTGESWDLDKEMENIRAARYVLKSDREILLKSLQKAWEGAGLIRDGYQLVNNSSGPVGITLHSEKGNVVVVRVWGIDDHKKKVIFKKEQKPLEPPVVIKVDERLAPGEKREQAGTRGEMVYNYKLVLIDGEVKEKILLWQEKKEPRAKVIYYGRGTFINK
ncbi:Putative peptidoglycan binding domain-containing protein [Thermosyntropha lipolytica DSM 11003]|uniref:Putative peptidoglycan binding domain-containing protein n=1 Tax=Thermosyntropha lipolytica DSM 11003 TaxID=1123382 RepID=A0A1M5MTZ2_9FIRM|nr:G5 domain-containing protein [Thermosyntropha lipolytica]SHG80850.1 Putative peptidoglycan binding domain-containing protein [Thermosyntropha lipolytica DSM 11003]